MAKKIISGIALIFQITLYSVSANPRPGLKFIANQSQWPSEINFSVKIQGGNLLIGSGSFTYSFLDQRRLEELHDYHQSREVIPNPLLNGQIIKSSFLGSNKNVIPKTFGIQPDYYNYFLGTDSTRWSSNVRAYEGAVYKNFYDGIDLKVYSEESNLKYDFIVLPGADYSIIKFQYAGADQLFIENDNLTVKTSIATLIEKKPVMYQIINGEKIFVKGQYELQNNIVSFCLDEWYDPCYELVIDPLLIFSTYSGFSADNWGSSATPGENGKLYSAGVVNLNNAGGSFPATPGAFQISYGGIYDVAIYKYDSTGGQLLYTSFLGGSESESPHSLVMTASNDLLILGTTSSTDLKTSLSAYDRTFNGGTFTSHVVNYSNGSDIFVAKISSDGTQLLACTYLGGSLNDGLNPTSSPLVKNYGDQLRGDIISDASGNIFISTVTSSVNFPVTNGFDLTYSGGDTDALILKLTSDLSQISWATFLGGSLADASHTIQIDKTGNLYVGGGSASVDFPITTGVYQSTNKGNGDGWIAKLSANGSSLLNSTFTGTSQFNQVYFLDLDKQENVYVYGQTEGTFPVTANVYNNPNSGQFIQKFDNSLSTLLFSTVFGSGIGIPNISPTAFLVNDCNNIFLAGWGGLVNSLEGFWRSTTDNMPVTNDAFQKTTSGSDFYLMVLSENANEILYATYLGGTTSRTHLDGGTCRFDKGGVVYHAVCSGCAAFNGAGHSTSDFPSTTNAWSRTNGSGNCNNAAFKFDLSSLKARIQTNSTLLDKPGLNKICVADTIVFQNQSIGGQVYYWNFGDGTTAVKSNKNNIPFKYKLPGFYTVKLKAVDIGTCVGKDSTQTKILVSTPQGFAGPDLVMCYNTTTQLSAGGGILYSWKSADKLVTLNEANPIVNPKIDTRYFVSITDINGCILKDTVDVRVVPNIDVKFTLDRINYNCFGKPSINVSSQTDKSEAVFFDFGDGFTSDMPSLVHQYEKDGNFSVRLIGKKETCIYEKQITVPIFELKVPNVFTPDQSPGFNDTFEIEYGGKPISQAGINVSLVVVNRWGGIVYEDKFYKDNWTAKDVPAGVYFYEAAIEGKTTCKGWVQVIK